MAHETSGDSSERLRLTVTHEEAINDPNIRERYRDERVARIKAGDSTWMLRGFDTDSDEGPGIAFDYYIGGLKRGFIEGDDLEGYHAYMFDPEGERAPIHLNREPIMLRNEAEVILRDAVSDTTL